MSSFLLNSYIILPSGAITIISQPTGGMVLPNTSFTFTTSGITSNGSLAYQWRENGIDIINNATLPSYTASQSAVGIYYYDCVITNTTFNNSVTSNSVALNVYAPFVFTINTSLLS